jgi:hypothetical protein
MHSRRLHKHKMSQMLHHKSIAGISIAQLGRLLLDRPSQIGLLRRIASERLGLRDGPPQDTAEHSHSRSASNL